MKTLTVTDARQKLGYWLKRAESGEEIGVVFGASIFALRKAQSKPPTTWKPSMASPKKKRTGRQSESGPKRETPAVVIYHRIPIF